jgi:hypothetical protein
VIHRVLLIEPLEPPLVSTFASGGDFSNRKPESLEAGIWASEGVGQARADLTSRPVPQTQKQDTFRGMKAR